MAESTDSLKKLVLGRQSSLENKKTPWEALWQEVTDYVIPYRDDIRGTQQSGTKKGTKVYDGTAIGAAVLATDGIHGYHVSPAFPWFRYAMSRADLNNNRDIRAWLQDGVEFSLYNALNRSNFYSEIWPFIYDGFTIGTAILLPEEDISEGRICFEAIHPGECYMAENRYGEIDVLHRKRKMTARQIVQKFGKEQVSDAVNNAYETSPFTEFEIIHAVFPREEYDPAKLDAKNKKYASVWVLTGADGKVIRESGYRRFPFKIWRYLRSGRDVYGFSPAIQALADVKGINLMSKTILGAAQLAIDPPLNVPSELAGKVQYRPRGLNYYKQDKRTISAINTAGNFPVAIDREQAKQKAIRDRFHVDTFLMLTNLAGSGQRTAYEVSELMSEKAAILGAELGPLNSTLDGVLDDVYEIETEAGRIPPPPDSMYAMAGPSDRFDPIYMGPLAQAQRSKFGSSGILQGINSITPMLQVFPEIADNIDPDKTAKKLLDASGFPADCMRDDDSVATIRRQKQEAMAQERQSMQMAQMAKGIKDAAGADQALAAGGPLGSMIKGAMPESQDEQVTNAGA